MTNNVDPLKITTTKPNKLDLVQRNQRLLEALEKISAQAVCVNMDGDDGNERMLKYILEIADKAIADIENTDLYPKLLHRCLALLEAHEAEGIQSELLAAHTMEILAELRAVDLNSH